MMARRLLAFVSGLLLAGLPPAAPLAADPVAEFYRGRTITLIVSQSTGGDYDARARLLARHLDRHVPGNPRLIVQNMPGAGGMRAASYVYNIAPRDGSVIGMPDQLAPLSQAFGEKGVEFDCTRMSYLANTSSSPIVMVSWHTSPVKRFEDLLKEELVIGGTGASSASVLMPLMVNSLIGTRFRPIPGYPGGNEIYLAMEKGEVAGRATQSWSGWKAQKPDWIAQKRINLLVQTGSRRHPELPDVPLLVDFARTAEDRQILEIYLAPVEIARPFLVGPDVPAERVAALRRAFDAAMADPILLSEAERSRIEIEPMRGEDVQTIVERIVRAPPSVLARAKAFSQAK
jgi:tripartite-type tricarboxylate transporter receptor subunit TctC